MNAIEINAQRLLDDEQGPALFLRAEHAHNAKAEALRRAGFWFDVAAEIDKQIPALEYDEAVERQADKVLDYYAAEIAAREVTP